MNNSTSIRKNFADFAKLVFCDKLLFFCWSTWCSVFW